MTEIVLRQQSKRITIRTSGSANASSVKDEVSTGFDGNPNDSGAPTAITACPKGTWYFNSSNEVWRKIDATYWYLANPESITGTNEDFTVGVDNGAGVDPPIPVPLYNQASSDAIGDFATIDALVESLALTSINHSINIQFTDGVHSSTQMPWHKISWGTDGDASPFVAQTGEVVLTSLNGRVIEPGTASMSVSSSSGAAGSHVVTLVSDPGLGVDAFQDSILEVTSGTGAGQYKPIRSHATTSFSVAGTFSPALDGTSVVEIRKPAASISLTETFPAIRFRSHTINFGLKFDNIDLTNVNALAGVRWEGGKVFITGGARFLNMLHRFEDASLIHETCVISKDTAGGTSTLSFFGGFFRTNAGTTEPLLLRSSVDPVGAFFDTLDRASGCFLFGGQQFDGYSDSALSASGGLTFLDISSSAGAVPVTDSSPTYALRLNDGAMLRASTAGDLALLDSTFTGTTEDIDLDGDDVGWSAVDADPENVMVGKKTSRIYEVA